MSTIDYKIPKIEIHTDIAVDNGTTFDIDEYILFLNQFSRYRKGQETIYEFLNKKKEFIPAKRANSGDLAILNHAQIVYVREKEKQKLPPHRQLVLFLKNSVQLEVGHVNPLPDSQSRVLDYLNQETEFILFYHDQQKIFVNKNKIIKVSEL